MTDTLRTRARAEADRRWPLPNITDPLPSDWHDKGMASGFVLGALWHAAQQPTVDEVAQAIRVADGDQTRTMSEQYVPTTEQVRGAYARAGFLPVSDGERNERRAAFDRYLTAHDRQVKAEALAEFEQYDERHWCTKACPDDCDVAVTRVWTRREVIERHEPPTEEDIAALCDRFPDLFRKKGQP